MTLWSCSTPRTWREVLHTTYPIVLEALTKYKSKHLELMKLEKWFQNELSNHIHLHNALNGEELSQLMRWKLSRGKNRPRLQQYVDELDSDAVKSASMEAFNVLSNDVTDVITRLRESLKALTTLKGVGPATASAILCAHSPHIAPFMADEAMLGCGFSSLRYDMKQYLEYATALHEKATELQRNRHDESPNKKRRKGEEGRNSDTVPLTVHDIELALWTEGVASRFNISMNIDADSTDDRDTSVKKTRKMK